MRAVRATLAALALLITACDVNPFDAAQVPSVVAAPGSAADQVTITWQPEGAQMVRVYRGTQAGDGYSPSLVWSVVATGENTLRSGLTYGTDSPSGGRTDVASQALVAGAPYTVQITRQDPKGSGSGFTNTNNRYVGTASFVAP